MKARIIPNEPSGAKLLVFSMNFLVLRCEDIERSLVFYQSLGLSFTRFRYSTLSGVSSECVKTQVPGPELPLTKDTEGAGVPIVTMELQPRADLPPTSSVVLGFFVSSVDDAVTAAVKSGGVLLSEPADWPWGRRAAAADPDGHRVELAETPWGRLTGSFPE